MDEPIQEAMRLFDNARAVCRGGCDQLFDIAAAFDRVGNQKVAEELRALARSLYLAEADIREGASHCVTQYSCAVAGGTHNMMNAILAMAKINDSASSEDIQP